MRTGAVGIDMIFDDLEGSELSGSRPGILTPKSEKSIAITTTVTIHAIAPMKKDRIDPITLAPIETQKAMNARTQATGCRTKALVRLSAVSLPARVNVV